VFAGHWIDPEFETRSAAEAAASTLACRGYMWSNQHPSASAWRPLRAPMALAADRAAAQNRAELAECAARGRHELDPALQIGIQVVPYARLLVAMLPQHNARMLLPVRWQKLWQGSILEEPGGGIAHGWNAEDEGRTDVFVSQVATEDEIEDA
jgi:hypothetical protein